MRQGSKLGRKKRPCSGRLHRWSKNIKEASLARGGGGWGETESRVVQGPVSCNKHSLSEFGSLWRGVFITAASTTLTNTNIDMYSTGVYLSVITCLIPSYLGVIQLADNIVLLHTVLLISVISNTLGILNHISEFYSYCWLVWILVLSSTRIC